MGCWQGNEGGVRGHCAQTFYRGLCETYNNTELGLVLYIQAAERRWILGSKDLLYFGRFRHDEKSLLSLNLGYPEHP
ncbi:hypothetical protein D3C81_1292540 [compost metagenome]